MGNIFAQSDADPESRNRFRIGANLKFLKLLIFSQQLISPKLYLISNPEDLNRWLKDDP